MNIRAEDISRILREQVGGYTVDVDVAEVGTVISIGDGMARLHGVERCMAGEMIDKYGYADVFRYVAAVGVLAILFVLLEWWRASQVPTVVEAGNTGKPA